MLVSIPLSVFIARYSSMECESLFLMWPLYTIPNSPKIEM